MKTAKTPVRLLRALLALLLAGSAAPAAAELLPEPHRIALPSEQAEFQAFAELLVRPMEGPGEALARLDGLLDRLKQPTRFRGLVQYARARAMAQMDDERAARDVVAESVRLLPGYSGPLLLGVDVHAYADEPAQAADYLLRAIALDPAVVREFPEYDLRNLLMRLVVRRDTRRLGLVSEQMLAIGWTGGLQTRSELARAAIEHRVEAGEIDAARALVPKLLVPADAHTLLIQRKYEPLWEAIETWSGPRLERLWPAYLSETRARWAASRDPELAVAHAHALRSAGHWETLVRDILPLFSQPLDRERDQQLVFVAAPLADALARRGRSAEIDPMFERALRTWPVGDDANALNLSGNRAVHRMYRGDLQGAIEGLDATLAEAARWEGQVSAGAFAVIHFHRACALHRAGRGAQAIASRAIVIATAALADAVKLELCFGNRAAARALPPTHCGASGAARRSSCSSRWARRRSPTRSSRRSTRGSRTCGRTRGCAPRPNGSGGYCLTRSTPRLLRKPERDNGPQDAPRPALSSAMKSSRACSSASVSPSCRTRPWSQLPSSPVTCSAAATAASCSPAERPRAKVARAPSRSGAVESIRERKPPTLPLRSRVQASRRSASARSSGL